jgi:hypothetical protein
MRRITDGTMLETDQIPPSKNGYVDTVTNADGSVDMWFGSAKPDDVAESNFRPPLTLPLCSRSPTPDAPLSSPW